jgi:hypothetical protein
MKVTKTTIYRLEFERSCGCKAERDYADNRYTKPYTVGTTVLCEKHLTKSPDAQEILQEVLIDNLTMQAEMANTQYAPLRQVEEGDMGGVIATGENVQAMGVKNLPNRRHDPLAVRKLNVDRPAPRGVQNLNIATEDIEFNEEIGAEALEDPRLSGIVSNGLEALEAELDNKDMELNGIPRSALKDAVD